MRIIDIVRMKNGRFVTAQTPVTAVNKHAGRSARVGYRGLDYDFLIGYARVTNLFVRVCT